MFSFLRPIPACFPICRIYDISEPQCVQSTFQRSGHTILLGALFERVVKLLNRDHYGNY